MSGNEFRRKVLKFVRFLALKLQLWMFIPCNSKGEPLEEPFDYGIYKHGIRGGNEEWNNQCQEYQKAKDRCLFKGFEISPSKHNIVIGNERIKLVYNTKLKSFSPIKSIQNLTNKVELTPEGIKQAGL
jgi:hypothetical protein